MLEDCVRANNVELFVFKRIEILQIPPQEANR